MRATVEEGNARLLQLAAMLEHVPEVHPITTDRGLSAKRGYYQVRLVHPCGSPACAWGHWVIQNTEARQRLMVPANSYYTRHTTDYDTGEEVSFLSIEPAADEFCLDLFEVNELFDAAGCANAQTGAEAAAYIRRFVANRTPQAKPAEAPVDLKKGPLA